MGASTDVRAWRVAAALLLLGCRRAPADVGATEKAASAIPVIDELRYFADLKAKRADLTRGEECYSNLVLKTKYRSRLLEGTDSVESLRKNTYAQTDEQRDRLWVESFQSSVMRYCREHGNLGGCTELCSSSCASCPAGPALVTQKVGPESIWPVGYDLCWFAGYYVGQREREPFDPSGRVRSWKVFFEFNDGITETLTPESYLAFTRALLAAGFHGDSKIPIGPGRARYQYNDIIVHGYSPADAKIAERIGLSHFGSALSGHARGLDLASPKGAKGELDWHHYLCAEGTELLLPAERAFVEFRD